MSDNPKKEKEVRAERKTGINAAELLQHEDRRTEPTPLILICIQIGMQVYLNLEISII